MPAKSQAQQKKKERDTEYLSGRGCSVSLYGTLLNVQYIANARNDAYQAGKEKPDWEYLTFDLRDDPASLAAFISALALTYNRIVDGMNEQAAKVVALRDAAPVNGHVPSQDA